MSDRPSRKRKMTAEGESFAKDMANKQMGTEQRKKIRVLRKNIDSDLSDLFGKMQATDEPRAPAAIDVEMGRGRRRKTRKGSKKSRKTRRKH